MLLDTDKEEEFGDYYKGSMGGGYQAIGFTEAGHMGSPKDLDDIRFHSSSKELELIELFNCLFDD
ncbi:MAG: hypothetical protein DRI24_19860 [Deltaproteobacteria bacterium]|nr:MAG: hypothetical protein DRI24_19860 [Deltaproteobacteria bacterium]